MTSNFWAKALGVQQPAAPAPQPVAQPVQPWYAPPVYQPQPQSQGFYPPVPQGQPYPGHPQAPAEEEQSGWGTVEGSTAKAKSARLDTTCPECGGSNYFRPEGFPNATPQCYNCGANGRFSQTGGQGGLPSDKSVPATPARQTAAGGAGGASQFRPDVIVGHL